MEYELIPDEVFDGLPEEPEEQFAILAKAAQASLNRLIDVQHSSNDFIIEVREQFMATMRAAAETLDIDGLPSVHDLANLSSYEEYRVFSTRLSAIVTRVRLKSQLHARPYSVQLGRITKARIRQEAEQLRVYLDASDLSPQQKRAVGKKIDELIAELEKVRMSFAQVTAITAALATTIAGSVTAIAKAPEAYQSITTILAAIGADKKREEDERERLAPPPKALPSPRNKVAAFDDLDDDVPF